MAVPASNQHNGAYFDNQLATSRLDIFAVVGLPATDHRLTPQAILMHLRDRVLPHVVDAGWDVPTKGPRVPAILHVKKVRQIMEAISEQEFRELQTFWSLISVQTWNPFAAIGSIEATSPRAVQPQCT